MVGFDDVFHQGWALVDESGVELDEFSSGFEFGRGVIGRHYTADTDDRDVVAEVAVKLCDDLSGSFCEWCT